jgi:hypothetical protein
MGYQPQSGPLQVGITSGASFPGSPTAGDQFFRTDLGILYYYTGSTWNVLSPTRPYAFSYCQVGAWTCTVSQYTVCPFDTAFFDLGGVFNSNGVFTAPVAGIWCFIVTGMQCGLTADQKEVVTGFFVNGTATGGQQANGTQRKIVANFSSGTAGPPYLGITGLLQLSQGDKVSVAIFNGDIANRAGSTGANQGPTFEGFLIG